MNDLAERLSKLSPLQRSMLALKQTQKRLEQLEQANSEPIAIIGEACRFPGAKDSDAYWKLLSDGQCSIQTVPISRWDLQKYYDADPEAPGKMYCKWGGFLEGIDLFDANFFGITSKEAMGMDPQQRLLLETAWRSIEDAGLTLDELRNSQTGVFIGMSTCDYRSIDPRWQRADRIDPYIGTGNVFSVAAGRLSYVLGLKGPSMAIDTACSSSLTCLHLACSSLRAQECATALVGGVNLLLWPEASVYFCKLKALSPDGLCKPFDASANGYVRAEGCGVVVLKRLSDALRQGDNILAILSGSAVNHDGPSLGLTAPNGAAQEAVIRAALAKARCKATDVQYVEAHGTGTSLGDPIELRALAAVMNGREHRCLIGSVKANIGHTEAAAGLAGLLKVILALRHKKIPKHLNVQQPTPLVNWNETSLELATELLQWPEGPGPRMAGLSSFGMSGANAHVIVQEAPEQQPVVSVPRPCQIIALSTKDSESFPAYARAVVDSIRENGSSNWDRLAYSLNGKRSAFPHRLAIVAENADDAIGQIEFALRSESSYATPVRNKPLVACLFPGQGSQYAQMSQSLLACEPVFRDSMRQCDAILAPWLGCSIIEKIVAERSQSLLAQTEYCQPALFAVEVSMFQLLKSWGIEPDILLGHSLGEYVAACVAGCMSLEDGLRLVTRRAQLFRQIAPGQGSMMAVLCERDVLVDCLSRNKLDLDIAAYNGPRNHVISGAATVIHKAGEVLAKEGVSVHALQVSHAFHSRMLEQLDAPMCELAREIATQPPSIPIVANLTGAIHTEAPDAQYWSSHLRSPVRFQQGVQTLLDQGVEVFLEVGPGTTLTGLVRQCSTTSPCLLNTLRQGIDDWKQLLTTVQQLFTKGVSVRWSNIGNATQSSSFRVPGHPFQKERFWFHDISVVNCSSSDVSEDGNHPLLGQAVRLARPEKVFEKQLTLERLPIVEEHCVDGESLLPAAAAIEWMLAGCLATGHDQPVALRDVRFVSKLALQAQQPLYSQLLVDLDGRIQLSTMQAESQWKLHADATIDADAVGINALAQLPCKSEQPSNAYRFSFNHSEFYREIEKFPARYGPSMRTVQQVGIVGTRADARLSLAANQPDETSYHLHPALLDGCFQILAVLGVGAHCGSDELYLPVACEQVHFYGPAAREVMCQIELHPSQHDSQPWRTADIDVFTSTNQPIASLRGLKMQRIAASSNSEATTKVDDWLYRIEWREQPIVPGLPRVNQPAEKVLELVRQHANDPAQQIDPLFQSELDLLCGIYVAEAMVTLRESGRTVAENRLRLWGRVQEIAHEDRQRGLQVGSVTSAQLHESLFARFPAWRSELLLLKNCATRLADVLTGDCDPLQLIFPGGSTALTESIYANSPVTSFGNEAVARAVQVAHQFATRVQRPLRILEIGAGTGGTTARLLDMLPVGTYQYCFTDISPLLVEKARSRFSKYPDLRFQVLDVERSLAQQGLADEEFDIVLAANVLHATQDLAQSCRNLRELLTDQGWLILLEGTGKQRWADLVFGLTDGWWRFTDIELRSEYPLLSVDQWRSFLIREGFEVEVVEPAKGTAAASVEQAIAIGSKQTRAFTNQNWLVVSDGTQVGDRLVSQLEAHGANCTVAKVGTTYQKQSATLWTIRPEVADDFLKLRRDALAEGDSWRGCIQCLPLMPEQSPVDPIVSCGSTLHLAQMLTSDRALVDGSLFILTRGAQVLAGDNEVPAAEQPSIHQATLWGLAKAMGLECAELHTKIMDLPTCLQADVLEPIWQELQQTSENQVAWRRGIRYVPRLTRYPTEPKRQMGEKHSQLQVETPGIPDSLAWRDATVPSPLPGQVRIRVAATGLNFRDVLNTLGAYRAAPAALGGECAGIIDAVGEGETKWRVGQRVVALADAAFASHVLANASLVAELPERVSLVQGACLPAAYLTSFLALVRLANLRPNESVLIHSASGGVGLAAVNLARRLGTNVFATAGSESKRQALRRMGIQYVWDSRTPTFAQEILAATKGRGVDVVLNSLTGPLIDASVQSLATAGRFIEIGRNAVWDEATFRAHHATGHYEVLSLDQFAIDQPVELGHHLQTLVEDVASGQLPQLPTCSYDAENVIAAFRSMAQARHVGKIVVTQASGKKESFAHHDSSWLITGGFGGLGVQVAQWLVERGVSELVLCGRRPPSADIQQTLENLRSQGVRIHCRYLNVGDRASVSALWNDPAYPPIRGVMHLAGALDNAVLQRQSWDRFQRVFEAKVKGSWNLHEESLKHETDYFVLFSSVASLLGSPGQANHSAANAFMDSLAKYRRSCGLPGLSINWGVWSDIGAGAAHTDSASRRGLNAISPQLGLAALESVWNCKESQVAVVPIDWKKLFKQSTGSHSFYADFVEFQPSTNANEFRSRDVKNPASMRGPSDKSKSLVERVKEQVATALGVSPARLNDGTRPFHDLGLDSLMSVELRNRLGQMLDISLPASLLFDYPTLDTLVKHLAQFDVAHPSSEVLPDQSAPPSRSATAFDEPLAVIGMSCRFPGADCPEEYWKVLVDGSCVVTEVPQSRWDVDDYYDPDYTQSKKTNSRWGGFLNQVDQFDPEFFGISPAEAVSMDPQQRLFLEVAWEALESSGVAPSSLSSTSAGVFLGMCGNDYAQICARSVDQNAYVSTGNAASVAAGRLAYLLGLQGPCMTVDTACSSSLVALHLACQSLRTGECDLAIAGGVQLLLTPDSTLALSKLGMMAPDGLCKTFDTEANGFVRGEGCGVVVLRRLSDAVQNRDPIQAVIRATKVNQDGRSSGMTAPNGPAQEKLIRQALQAAEVAPCEIDYVEAHGTGTSLGDPIEVNALGNVLNVGRSASNSLYIGSAKANVGHLEAAAGMAGLIKTILAIKHQQIPPQANFRNPSQHIDWKNWHLTIPTRPVDWKRGDKARIAGVSAFGFSGTNAHAIVQEPPLVTPTSSSRDFYVVPLSAQSSTAAWKLIEEVTAWLVQHPNERLLDVCGTAANGRNHFRHRMAIVCSSTNDLIEQLHQARIQSEFQFHDEEPRIVFSETPCGSVDIASFMRLYEQSKVVKQTTDLFIAELGQSPGVANLLQGVWGPCLQTCALVALLRSWGIVATAIRDESSGSIMADYVRGQATIEQLVARLAVMSAADAVPSVGYSIAIKSLACGELSSAPGFLAKLVAISYEQGVAVRWSAIYENHTYDRAALPTYPFHRRRFWLGEAPAAVGSQWTYRLQFDRIAPSSTFLPIAPSPVLTTSVAGPKSGRWLVVGDDLLVLETFSARLEESGITNERMLFQSEQDIALMRSSLHRSTWDCIAVCMLAPETRSFDPQVDEGLWRRMAQRSHRLSLLLKLLLETGSVPCRLITRGAVSLDGSGHLDLETSPLWGFARTIALEHPDLWKGMWDFASDDQTFSGLGACLAADERYDQIVVRDDSLLIPRLVKLEVSATQHTEIRADSLYIISGGLGSMGTQVATWLVARGARRLMLLGRRPWDDIAAERRGAIEQLRQQGADVDVRRVDVADEQQMCELVMELNNRRDHVAGIVHAAGEVRGVASHDYSEAEFTSLNASKMQGAWNLHRLSLQSFDGRAPDFFVLFSSAASVWGSQNSGAYSAGNHFVDMLAHWRRSHKQPALVVNWGRLSERGMLEEQGAAGLRKTGLREIPIADAMSVLDHLIASDTVQAIVANVDWGLFSQVYLARRDRPLLDELIRETPRASSALSASLAGALHSSTIIAELESLPDSQRSAYLASIVRNELARVLKIEDATSLGLSEGFFALGMDSLIAVELKDSLQRVLGIEIPLAALMNHGSSSALAAHLIESNSLALSVAEESVENDFESGTQSSQWIDYVDQMTDEEVERALQNRLGGADL